MSVKYTDMPKTPRWNRPVIVTEKIDGTNAGVLICGDGTIMACSKEQILFPTVPDNKGFRAWVEENAESLRALGPGLHRGEWWGQKIGRKYGGIPRRFSLFNVSRWCGRAGLEPDSWLQYLAERKIVRTMVPACCDVVPVIDVLPYPDTLRIEYLLDDLRRKGSVAAPGFMRPEGLVLFHTSSQEVYKVTCENDASPKGPQPERVEPDMRDSDL